jgi:hypothetical protein
MTLYMEGLISVFSVFWIRSRLIQVTFARYEWFIEFMEKSHRVSEHGVVPGWFSTRSSLNGFCMMYISFQWLSSS